jgi:dsDNA-binding SOS-regulon protein
MPVNHFKGKQMLSSEKEKELDLFMSQINENLDQILNVGNKDSSGSESNPEADNLHDNEVVSFQK